jgi:hypothetical protein
MEKCFVSLNCSSLVEHLSTLGVTSVACAAAQGIAGENYLNASGGCAVSHVARDAINQETGCPAGCELFRQSSALQGA